jgi:hypothetical protein
MSRERAPREEPPRRPEGPRDGSGGGGGVPRQAPGSAPGGVGGGRRRAGAPEFGPAELAAALHERVSAIGASGPPRAGLARVRRRAKARQRRHSVMAGSAGVLMLAVAVSALTGNSFDIVPVLTGVVGLGGSHDTTDGSPRPRESGAGVRTVRPPAGAAGKKGPAIGPVDAVAGEPTALAATGVARCTAADLTTVTTVDAVIDGVSYGRVEAIAQHACAVGGPPVLQVENAVGTAASSVVILQHAQSDGARLPDVPTWGAVLKLTAGQGYDFQFAWAPDGCAGADTPADAAASSATTGPSVPASGQSSASTYTLSYLIGDVTPTEPVDLSAACGATVYVTDIYPRGAYPTAKAPASPSAQPATSSAPPTTPSPTTASPSTSPTATSSSPAAPSSSASSSDAGTGDSPAGGAPSASPPSQPTS